MIQSELLGSGNGPRAEVLTNETNPEVGRMADPLKPNSSNPDAKVLIHLFRMADNYRASNATNSAIEMYFMFLREHPETIQAEMAHERLLEIAENFEAMGHTRQARALYESLL